METIINKKKYIIGMNNRTLLLVILIFSMQISLISAVGDIGTVKQNNCIDLYNFCPTCSYVNLTAIQTPDKTVDKMNEAMVKTNNDFTFSFCNTTELGEYFYTTCGDKAGTVACEDIKFQVSPSGRSGNANIALVIILIVVIYTITFISFFGKNIPLSILTGMIMTFFGVWIIRNGIVVYRDNLTNYFGYVTIGVGFIISMWATIEWLMEEVF